MYIRLCQSGTQLIYRIVESVIQLTYRIVEFDIQLTYDGNLYVGLNPSSESGVHFIYWILQSGMLLILTRLYNLICILLSISISLYPFLSFH